MGGVLVGQVVDVALRHHAATSGLSHLLALVAHAAVWSWVSRVVWRGPGFMPAALGLWAVVYLIRRRRRRRA